LTQANAVLLASADVDVDELVNNPVDDVVEDPDPVAELDELDGDPVDELDEFDVDTVEDTVDDAVEDPVDELGGA
jgi:hypothetical protein